MEQAGGDGDGGAAARVSLTSPGGAGPFSGFLAHGAGAVHDLYRDQITAVQLADLYRGTPSKSGGHEGHPMFGRGTLRETPPPPSTPPARAWHVLNRAARL